MPGEPKLLPCPFCGVEADAAKVGRPHWYPGWIAKAPHKVGCVLFFTTPWAKTRASVVATWNRRAK